MGQTSLSSLTDMGEVKRTEQGKKGPFTRGWWVHHVFALLSENLTSYANFCSPCRTHLESEVLHGS